MEKHLEDLQTNGEVITHFGYKSKISEQSRTNEKELPSKKN